VISLAFRCEGGNAVAAVAISNRGDSTAFSVQLTQASLTSPAQNGSPLPQSYGDIGPGQLVAHDVSFGSYPAGSQVMKLKGTYAAGTLQFSATQAVQIPGCTLAPNTASTLNATSASYGPRRDRLVTPEDVDLWLFLTSISKQVPTSPEWFPAFNLNPSEAELLLYWLAVDTYFQRGPQQPSRLLVVHVIPSVSRISNNGDNKGVEK
jgi:hypothetical protein